MYVSVGKCTWVVHAIFKTVGGSRKMLLRSFLV